MRLTADTKIKLSQIKDFINWCGYLKDAKEWDENDHPRGNKGNAGQFTRVYCGNLKENQKDLQDTFDNANIPEEEQNALTEYSNGLSDEINEYRRDENAEENPELDRQIELLDRALERTTLQKNIKTYRTVNSKSEEIEKILNIPGLAKIPDEEKQDFINEQLKSRKIKAHDEAYLSTTIDKKYKHKKRRGNQKKTTYQLQYAINAPAEAHGLYIESITAYPGQNEVLLFRENDLDLKRIKFNDYNKTFFINADLIIEVESDDK